MSLAATYKKQKKEIISWARRLYEKDFVAGASGNISMKAGRNGLLITAAGSYLSCLKESDVVLINPAGGMLRGKGKPTSEKKLHLDIHANFSETVVLHAHPPFTTLFFSRYKKIRPMSFEAGLYLEGVRVIPQRTPNVVDTRPVIKALASCKIVVLGHHGVVAIGADFRKAFSLIEILEREAMLNIIAKGIHE